MKNYKILLVCAVVASAGFLGTTFAAGTKKTGDACVDKDFMVSSPEPGTLAACQSRASNGNQAVEGSGENPSGRCGSGLTTDGTSFLCGAVAIGEEAAE